MSKSTLALVVVGALALGACGRPAAVPGGDIKLVSVAVDLPDDPQLFPAGHAVLDANCTACHSASMVLVQPPLKPEQWQATVTKMREAYKAPIADADVPAILKDLSAISAHAGATAPARRD